MNRITDYKKLQDDIVAWIKDYATTNNIKSLVVGVSGGIDSAVVSTLCAMTDLPTWCAVLPIHSDPEHQQIAIRHIHSRLGQYSNVGMEVVDLSAVWDAMYVATTGTFSTQHAWANTKSRIRMTYLYQMACSTGGIVVGTGNKVEDFGIGFATKGGDLQCDISPIADLYKTEVRELGRYIGISQEILDAAPTDGLWGEQQKTDEECLGATYEELEWAMENIKTVKYSTGDQSWIQLAIDKEGCTIRQLEVLSIYQRLHNQNQHKMQPIPIYKLPL